MQRSCSICGVPAGEGKAELRPYGEGGADVCAGCVLGNPEREDEARKHLAVRLTHPGPLVLDSRDQIGPVPLKVEGDA